MTGRRLIGVVATASGAGAIAAGRVTRRAPIHTRPAAASATPIHDHAPNGRDGADGATGTDDATSRAASHAAAPGAIAPFAPRTTRCSSKHTVGRAAASASWPATRHAAIGSPADATSWQRPHAAAPTIGTTTGTAGRNG